MMPAVHHLSQLLVWTQDAQILTAQARAKELLVDNGWIFGGFFLVVAALVAVLYTTRTGVIARAAAKEAIRQPVFPLLLTISLVMMVFNTFIPFFSLGEDVKMMEVCGLAMLLICGMFLAIWTSSMSIADEIEGKTAMTMLSKPVNRRQFILGKFLGIQTAVLLMALPIVLAFAGLTVYKVFYDARESTRDDVTIENAVIEVLRLMPAVVLVLLEIMVMSAISVALSTRVPMVVNLVTCLAIFVVGHLTETLVVSNMGKLELVGFMARLVAMVLPAVGMFNVEAKLMTDGSVPPVYVGWAAVYAGAYIMAAILLAFWLFEDRDLA
ncbi:MAG: ABC transporter permease [Planctomycetaceae bacterium]|jgi:ABC-type transport system involved in multi-copper enzyme maturation permease subunit